MAAYLPMQPARVAALRREYTRAGLDEADLAPDPITQLRRWLGDAIAAELPEPNAMTLATATPQGRPSARTVLLKAVDDRGLVFFTNYDSRKGRELAANPHAALVLAWVPLQRQVCVTGAVERVSSVESDAYFASRPLGSQLGAWASPQSRVIADRAELDERLTELHARYPGENVPRPPSWGGLRVAPDAIEFWQGRPNRLHDRLRYVRTAAPPAAGASGPGRHGAWRVERLAP